MGDCDQENASTVTPGPLLQRDGEKPAGKACPADSHPFPCPAPQ